MGRCRGAALPRAGAWSPPAPRLSWEPPPKPGVAAGIALAQKRSPVFAPGLKREHSKAHGKLQGWRPGGCGGREPPARACCPQQWGGRGSGNPAGRAGEGRRLKSFQKINMLRLCKLGNINMEIIGMCVDYISFPSAGLEKSVGSRRKAARRSLLPCANFCLCGAERQPAGQGGKEQWRHGGRCGASTRPRGSEGLHRLGSVLSCQREAEQPPPPAQPPGAWEVSPRSASQRDTFILYLRLPFCLQQTL